MLACVVALHLAVLAQSPALPGGDGGEAPPGEAMPPVEEAPPAADAPDQAPSGRAAAPGPAAVPRPRQHSLLSAESLQGGSAALAWAGWSDLGAMYAIGFSQRDDAGVFLAHDWAKSETRAGVLYRRPFSRAGPFDVAARFTLAWWVNSGATFVYEENRSDRGFELVPGLALSRPGGGGLVSALLEAPMTLTWKYDPGFLFSPRASVAFETPLYRSFTVGARVGVGYRAGAGDAPLDDGRGELMFLVLAGYQLL
jgi:hypothetical protein